MNETEEIIYSDSEIPSPENSDSEDFSPTLCEYGEESQNTTESQQQPMRIPQPVTTRLMVLFGGSIGCLLIGIVVGILMGDITLFGLSVIIFLTMGGKGYFLYKKAKAGSIYCVKGVCVESTPKLLHRYLKTSFVDVDSETCDESSILLPKKIIFKIGHKYAVYFDRPLRTPGDQNETQWLDPDSFPTEGFIGFEHKGIYKEKPTTKEESNEK